ncbi:MAG: chemotaxis protein CheB [Acidobacteria bacterium]|nr:chemotaxis protein CheB [Acidobacteriota bacterium]
MTNDPPEAERTALVAIGCSAGGPQALIAILPALPRGAGAAIVVAQHMPGRFTTLFAARLARLCALPVREPQDGEALRPGEIYIARGGQQTTLAGPPEAPVFRVRPRAPGERYSPSADLLMASAAAVFGPGALGVLMSGMGGDGVAGLKAIKERRGRTIAESERSAAVFGMPREAIRAGLADRVLSREEIALEMARLI